MKKAFIFDLDGTLLDSMSIWDTVGEKYLFSLGIKHIPLNLKEILKPMSLLDSANYFISEFNLNKNPQEICDEINLMIESLYKNKVELKAGVKKFLIKNSMHKMCVATATDKYLVEYALTRLGIMKYFKFILTSSEVGNSKENPEIFILSARKLQEPIENCIVFEDALHALKTAKKAGFYTVGVYEKCFENDLKEIKKYSNQFVDNLMEVNI